MSGFTNKLNLYEFLAIFFPGCILLLELYISVCHVDIFECHCKCFCRYCCECSLCGFIKSHQILTSLLFSMFSYMIGCITHLLTDWWCASFRNNTIHISYIYHQIPKERKQALKLLWGDQNDEGTGCCCLLQCPCCILRYVTMALIILLGPFGRLFKCLCKAGNKIGSHEILDKYYTAYYYVEKNRSSAPIGFIEGQIALCRNMILPILLVPYACISLYPNLENLRWVFVLYAIILIVFVIGRQEKLYSLILEDYEYIKRMEK